MSKIPSIGFSPIKIRLSDLNKSKSEELKKLVSDSIDSSKTVQNLKKLEYSDARALFAAMLSGSVAVKPETSEVEDGYFRLPDGACPDEYQIKAAQNLHDGNSTLVCAPTGTGKTAIAQYIISKNLEEGKRTFYLTPLKALSNQKLLEFTKVYGEENVGILTGDRKENADAPIIIMTTEVYRNMAFNSFFKRLKGEQSQDLESKEPQTIIYDEIHYLGDIDRGVSWEESIMFTPKDRQVLGLSATIGNDEQLTRWFRRSNAQNVQLVHVPPENRHVPLVFSEYSAETHQIRDYDYEDEIKYNKKQRISPKSGSEQKFATIEDYLSIIYNLDNTRKLPAIFFVFSKKYSAKLLEECSQNGKDLTNDTEKKEIDNIYKKYKENYGYIGQDINYEALKKGYAIHNAGILPMQKEMIEEMFQKKLLKVVFATETLAAGINMPAKTVVISSPDKPSSAPNAENGRRKLTPNEYHQMAGRAGRRGLDEEGYVINMGVNTQSRMIFKNLVDASANPIESKFKPSYSLISNYHAHISTSEKLKSIFANTFRFMQEQDKNSKNTIQTMTRIYDRKCKLLNDEGFLESRNGDEKTLTTKGKLLHNIVGYQQIPLLNLITDKSLQRLSSEDLIFLAASIVSGQYNFNEDEEEKINWKQPSNAIKSNLKYLHDPAAEQKTINLDEVMKKYIEYNDVYGKNLKKHSISDEQLEIPDMEFAALIYNFGFLNSTTPNQSIENWQKTLSVLPENGLLKDEGSLYNAVNQTTDLLSQMIDLCKEAATFEEIQNDRQYYRILAAKLKTSMLLLKQPPIQDYKYEH